MSYSIPLSNNNILTTVQDGSFTNQYSNVNLVGKNFVGYGQLMNENIKHLLENFANSNPPQNPLIGQLWYDSDKKILKVFGTDKNWLEISYTNTSENKPTDPKLGDQWWDSKNNQLDVWTGEAWLPIGPSWSKNQGLTGAIAETVVDRGGASHVILKIYIGKQVVGVWSKDSTFILADEYIIPGVSATVNPGLTLALLGSIKQNLIGAQGYTGSRGNIGPTGPKGASGPTGAIGPPGPRGIMGWRGDPGYTGSYGRIGATGPSGPRGFEGYTGSASAAVGPTGVTGYTGSAGDSGINLLKVVGSANQVLFKDSSNTPAGSPKLTFVPGFNDSVLSVGGSIVSAGSITASGDVTAYSDKKLKSQIETISDALSLVLQLRGVSYVRKETKEPGVGAIAQEVEEIVPALVRTGEDGIKSLNYGGFAGIFIEAIKSQQQQIDDLKKQLEQLLNK